MTDGPRTSGERADVWIDLSNSPHIPFFVPIVAALRARGVTVTLTARDFAQTRELATQEFGDVTVIGGWGRGMPAKAGAVAGRALALARHAHGRRFRLAVSHNSYGQILAARLLGVPAITMMDYEHQPANHLAFRLARLVMVPEVFPAEALRRFGARRIRRYPGLKEQVYLDGTAPPEGLREGLGAGHKVLAVLRPPPDAATYHRFENPLFDRAVDRVVADECCVGLLLPRTPAQAAWAGQRWGDRVVTPGTVLPGAALLAAADLVVGGGGTMTREAALLGTPAYSLFAGRPSAVDAYLAGQGLLTFVRTESDLERLVVARKLAPAPAGPALGGGDANPTREAIVAGVLDTLAGL